MLLAGAASRIVTPPLFVPFLTSSGLGTSAPFESVHDDLYARALVLESGGTSACLICVDSLGYDNDILGAGRSFTAELRARVSARTGIPEAAVTLAATHTHTGPETIDLTPFRAVDGVADWLEHHLGELAEVAAAAWEARQPAAVRSGSRRVPGWAAYRRNIGEDGVVYSNWRVPADKRIVWTGKTDDLMTAVALDGDEGAVIATLINFTAHPVMAMCLPHVSADYPGVICDHVSRATGGAPCLFTNGACGNVNSPGVSSGFDDMAAQTAPLAAAAAELVQRVRSGAVESDGFAVDRRTIELPRKRTRDLDVVEAERAHACSDPSSLPDSARVALFRELRLARKVSRPLTVDAQALRIGNAVLVTGPGELFVETGLAVKAAFPDYNTIVVGYANDWIGYVPTPEAYAQGGYEVMDGPWNRVTAEAEPLLRREMIAAAAAVQSRQA